MLTMLTDCGSLNADSHRESKQSSQTHCVYIYIYIYTISLSSRVSSSRVVTFSGQKNIQALESKSQRRILVHVLLGRGLDITNFEPGKVLF